MIRRPPRSTRTDTPVPYTTRVRSRRRPASFPTAPSIHHHAMAAKEAQQRQQRQTEEGELVALDPAEQLRPEQIGRAHSELQSLMRISYAVFSSKTKTHLLHRLLREHNQPHDVQGTKSHSNLY